MNINFRTPISEELATIFVAEFDRDDAAEQWVAYEANAFNHTQWQEAKRSLEVFRLGLRERQLVLQAFDARVLKHPFSFLEAFTEIGPDADIEFLADRYLVGRVDLPELKNRLRLECRNLNNQLQQFMEKFYGDHNA